MMCTEIPAAEFARAKFPAHCAKGSRSYTYRTYAGARVYNALGGVNYLRPSEGVVVEQSQGWTAVKTGRSTFDLVASDLMGSPIKVGDKIALTFYQLRRFDRKLADGSEDPAINGCRSMMLTGVESRFPVCWDADRDRSRYARDGFGAEPKQNIRNPYLQDMIEQIEMTKSSNPLRSVVNVLIDGYVDHLSFVDPPELESCNEDRTKWPSICMQVKTNDAAPMLAIRYDRGMDTYAVDVNATVQAEHVTFDELGGVLEEIIGDDDWIKAKITLLKAAPVKRARAAELNLALVA